VALRFQLAAAPAFESYNKFSSLPEMTSRQTGLPCFAVEPQQEINPSIAENTFAVENHHRVAAQIRTVIVSTSVASALSVRFMIEDLPEGLLQSGIVGAKAAAGGSPM
jgi:hypothetical protein